MIVIWTRVREFSARLDLHSLLDGKRWISTRLTMIRHGRSDQVDAKSNPSRRWNDIRWCLIMLLAVFEWTISNSDRNEVQAPKTRGGAYLRDGYRVYARTTYFSVYSLDSWSPASMATTIGAYWPDKTAFVLSV